MCARQMQYLLLKLNVGCLEDPKIGLIGAGNLGWETWEVQLFKWVLKKYECRGSAEEAGFTLEAIVKQRASPPGGSVCLCRGRGLICVKHSPKCLRIFSC